MRSKVTVYTKGSQRWSSPLNLLIKGILLMGFALFIYKEIVSEESIHQIWQSFKINVYSANVIWVVIAISLVPLNWALEAIKWKDLTSKFEQIPFSKAFLSILCGLSIGIFTPQRIGEYGGRILVLKKSNSWRGILATFISSISQNLFNISLGFVGAILYVLRFTDAPRYVLISFISFAIVIISISFFFYYNLDLLLRWVQKLPIISKNEKVKKLASRKNIYNAEDLTRFNVYSLMRYMVYASQYILLLYFFGVSSSIITLIIAVSTIFLVQSSIPIPPMFGILARAEIALIILGVSAANELSILSATFSLGIINLLIPSFFGLIVVLKINVLQRFTPDTPE